MNVLFVCSKNKWRSRTAETIYKSSTRHCVKSAGTADDARIKLSVTLLEWADIIFVMEYKHRQLIHRKYYETVQHKPLYVLDIPDEYQYMDEELIDAIHIAVHPYLEE